MDFALKQTGKFLGILFFAGQIVADIKLRVRNRHCHTG